MLCIKKLIINKTHKTLIRSTRKSRTSNLIYEHKTGPVQLGTLRSDKLIPCQFKQKKIADKTYSP